MNQRITARGIFVHEGKLLCVRQIHPERGEVSNFWNTIGGKVEKNEALMSAINREIYEETGIKPEVGHLLFVMQYASPGLENLEFFFYIKNADDYVYVDLSKTTHGQAEIAEIAYINPKEQNVLPEFLQTLDLTDIEQVKPVQFFSYL